MIFLIGIYLLLIGVAVLESAFAWVMRFLPYVYSFFVALLVFILWKPLQNLIPEHGFLSFLSVLAIVEVITLALLIFEQTNKAMIVLLCTMVPSFLVMLVAGHVEIASWQLAVFLTIVHVIALAVQVGISIYHHESFFQTSNHLFFAIITGILYAASALMIVYSVTYCYWNNYIEMAEEGTIYNIARGAIGALAALAGLGIPIVRYINEKDAQGVVGMDSAHMEPEVEAGQQLENE